MNQFLSIVSITFLLISCFSQKEGMIKYYNYFIQKIVSSNLYISTIVFS